MLGCCLIVIFSELLLQQNAVCSTQCGQSQSVRSRLGSFSVLVSQSVAAVTSGAAQPSGTVDTGVVSGPGAAHCHCH